MTKICPTCGVVTSNLRKHKKRNRCARQHIRKKIKEVLEMTKGYENFPIPKPPDDFPDDDEEEEEEDLIPTWHGEKNEDS